MSQIFKKEVSLHELYNALYGILYDIQLYNNSSVSPLEILINKSVFKRAELHQQIQPLLTNLKPYYNKSKQHYLSRPINYNNFMTIIRQLCNVNNINYSSKIVYAQSDYEIEYSIFLQPNNACKSTGNQ